MKRAFLVALVLNAIACAAIFLDFGILPKAHISVQENNVSPMEFHQKNRDLNILNVYKLLSPKEREQHFRHAYLSFDPDNFQTDLYRLRHPEIKVIKGETVETKRKYVVVFSECSPDKGFFQVRS